MHKTTCRITRLMRSLILLPLIISFNTMADSTVTITLQGFVSITCLATFDSAGTGQNLDLTRDTTDELVADGTLFCNDPQGFTVSLTSQNGVAKGVNTGLFLPLSVSDTNQLPYDLKFKLLSSGTTADVVFANGVAPSQIIGAAGGAINEAFQLEMTYVGDTSLTADSYTDQLTLSVIAL